jgi:murein DD-endopeptidase MepM/ murein hydrolase activator NlpD
VSSAGPRQAGRLRLQIVVAIAAMLVALAAALLPARPASGADLEERLDATQAKIDRAEQAEGVLTTRIEALGDRIGRLEGEVALLRRREAVVAARLAAKQAELDRAVAKLSRAHDHLEVVRARLRRALVQLREMLVAVYESGAPDVLSVILSADGFDDLVERSEYLQRIQQQDELTIARVRELRDEVKQTVRRLKLAKQTIERARDAIAVQKQRVASARGAVEARQAKLVAARGERQAVLDRVEGHVDHLEGIEADLQAEIQAKIAAETGGVALPAGPVPAASAAGLIWPVDGVLTSGFGMRWGRMHEGIDISVPEGTPIRAAASGSVILAAYSGGYGNYTCIDHGGGLSTCYGHQSGFAVSAGEGVVQGETIGYSGNTGSSTGPHLHFEVRVNGVAVDPLGYL